MKKILCNACALGCQTKNNNAAKGWGNPEAKLVIVLDSPGDVMAEKLLVWILQKLSLTSNDVWVDYTFKCPIESKVKKELYLTYHKTCWETHSRNEIENNVSLVLCGNYSVILLADEKMKELHGRKAETGAWCIYSMAYLLMNPAECVDAYRCIYKAAEEAGLKPKMNMDLPVFKFPSKKLR